MNFQKVLNEYKKQDKKFLLQVLDSAKFLEDLTGISELLQDDAVSLSQEILFIY